MVQWLSLARLSSGRRARRFESCSVRAAALNAPIVADRRRQAPRPRRGSAAGSSGARRTAAGSSSTVGSSERARQLEAERVGHLLDLRQIAEVVQAEPIEELARRRVHERAADHLLAADGLDQLALDQRRQHAAAAADAADLGDLRRRDRLLVGDDRQRLERLHRQLLRRPLVEQLAHPFVQLGPRHDLVAARDLDDLQAARALVVGAARAASAASTSSRGSPSSSL